MLKEICSPTYIQSQRFDCDLALNIKLKYKRSGRVE